jgi:hypothetical protein
VTAAGPVTVASLANGRGAVALKAFGLIAFTIAVLMARRPDQFAHPYIWIEDGTIILKGFAERGVAVMWEPLAGYLVLSTKLLSLSAFKLSVAWAPEIMVALITAFTCLVILAIAFSPTHLPLPWLCAIATLLIPTEPEVFAISELSFWWAGLLCVLALLWNAERGASWLRAGFLVFGGLSSPIGVPIAALLVLRALIERRRSECLAAAVAVIVAGVQIHTFRGTGYTVSYGNLLDPDLPLWSLNKFLAYFFAGHRYGGYYLGPVFLAVLCHAIWRIRARVSPTFVLLVLAWGAICVTAVLRAPIGIIDPMNSGARYFFYPFTLYAWMWIWIAVLSPLWVRSLVAAGFVMGIGWAYKGMTRSHDTVDWRAHLAQCARSEDYALPVHFTGAANNMWYVWLTGRECRDLIAGSILRGR